ncbi:unnamed protein product, partial [Laminaria digitata]
FFVARFFLAAIAPLLFGRVLSLAQVDKYLGPMTQIIWAMLFHLARFSVFMLVTMASFALAFYSLYGSCNGDLRTAYSTPSVALLSMFKAMLGGKRHIAIHSYIGRDLCSGPAWEYEAGITLLVMYVVTMSILMLNLLIAVLGTVHDSVSQHAEVEFNLARNQFIQRGASVVNDGHLPPPFNLVVAVSLIVIDIFGEVCYQLGLCPQEDDDELDEDHFRPLSQTNGVLVLQGTLQRLLFACSMGLLALAGSAVLWLVSLPSVAMRILRW